MTNWGPALAYLGLAGQDFGPISDGTYAQLLAGWRGTVACPSEADLNAALSTIADPSYVAAQKTAKATAGLNTVQNKTLLDVMWELHRAIRGQITLPTETKAQYADRLKGMWAANEP